MDYWHADSSSEGVPPISCHTSSAAGLVAQWRPRHGVSPISSKPGCLLLLVKNRHGLRHIPCHAWPYQGGWRVLEIVHSPSAVGWLETTIPQWRNGAGLHQKPCLPQVEYFPCKKLCKGASQGYREVQYKHLAENRGSSNSTLAVTDRSSLLGSTELILKQLL